MITATVANYSCFKLLYNNVVKYNIIFMYQNFVSGLAVWVRRYFYKVDTLLSLCSNLLCIPSKRCVHMVLMFLTDKCSNITCIEHLKC